VAPVTDLDIPDRPGGWWHEYVCPTHGVELLPARDGGFPCGYGCVWQGEPYSGAWAVLAHQAAARSLRRLAVAARAGDREAADASVAGLTRYAKLYERLATGKHPDAQGWMLSGRLFQQALTEAIWGTSLAHAVQTLAGEVDHEQLKPAADLLRALREAARGAREVLVDRDDFRNNYTAWLNAAGASTSRALALLGEPDETAEWLTGRYGVAAHAAAAVHPDGWEWEGSSYYHVFVLRGYLLALRGCPSETVPDTLVPRLHDMIAVVAALSTDRGGTLPALHDTPYAGPRWDDELYELCLLSAQLPGAPSLRRLAEPLAARLRPDLEDNWRSAESRGWFGTAQPESAAAGQRSSLLFPDTGYAVLHGTSYQAVLRATRRLTRAPGQARPLPLRAERPLAARLRRPPVRPSAAPRLLRTDRRPPHPHRGRCRAAGDHRPAALLAGRGPHRGGRRGGRLPGRAVRAAPARRRRAAGGPGAGRGRPGT
jgi:hypothetical protein